MSDAPKSVLVTGASGLIGSTLIPSLAAQGYRTVSLTRKRPTSTAAGNQLRWDLTSASPAQEDAKAWAEERFSAVIHLAGEPVMGIWTSAKKQRIFKSRADGTRNLCAYLAALPSEQRPEVLVSASAIGIYGNRGDALLTELSSAGKGFLAETCLEWERATQAARDAGVRVVNLRIGIVLTSKGGALTAMLPAFRIGLGGRMGSGDQWMSWVALEDLNAAILYSMEHHDVAGPVNAVAPNPVTNAEFTRALANVLGRPAIIPVPAFAMKLLPGGMANETFLASARVLPKALLDRDFGFQFPTLEHALQRATGH